LVDVCAYNNLLNLPVINPEGSTIFGGGEYATPSASADQVEAAIQKHFDVTSAYLRTSSLYKADTNTYQMCNGWGGGWHTIATSASQNGNRIVINIATLGPDAGAVLQPVGILTIELQNGNVVKYISYQCTDPNPYSQ